MLSRAIRTYEHTGTLSQELYKAGGWPQNIQSVVGVDRGGRHQRAEKQPDQDRDQQVVTIGEVPYNSPRRLQGPTASAYVDSRVLDGVRSSRVRKTASPDEDARYEEPRCGRRKPGRGSPIPSYIIIVTEKRNE
ncbi:uncharacterized protein Dyak_GE27512 [Drosophila yakuba]|uniref:Uncharacterized protein n=1 Tax=Drosophila yakuba TaxID=7245 RepID=A0A0R1E7Z2_DROYA|nr:uncharacterized protein Dyak_GE27512 [Drosophila yakuba]